MYKGDNWKAKRVGKNVLSFPALDTKQFTLAIHVQGEGSLEPAEGKHRFDPNTVVDLTATPIIGWSFKEWIGEATNTGDATRQFLWNEIKKDL